MELERPKSWILNAAFPFVCLIFLKINSGNIHYSILWIKGILESSNVGVFCSDISSSSHPDYHQDLSKTNLSFIHSTKDNYDFSYLLFIFISKRFTTWDALNRFMTVTYFHWAWLTGSCLNDSLIQSASGSE